jgi:hypothetical protein
MLFIINGQPVILIDETTHMLKDAVVLEIREE